MRSTGSIGPLWDCLIQIASSRPRSVIGCQEVVEEYVCEGVHLLIVTAAFLHNRIRIFAYQLELIPVRPCPLLHLLTRNLEMELKSNRIANSERLRCPVVA